MVSARPLDGKLAVISGASRGIGGAAAENLAAKGCNIAIHYNSDKSEKDAIELAARLMKAHSVQCETFKADLSVDGAPESFVDDIKSRFQNDSGRFVIDILINNAGMVHNADLGQIKAEDFFKVYKINALAPLMLTQAVMPYLPTDRTGRIVNVSSVSSQTGFTDQSIYGGSKAALESCTRSWARQLVERCTVNAINPGPVKTEMWGGLEDSFYTMMNPYIKLAPTMAVRDDDDEDTKKEGKKLGGRPAEAREIAGIIGMLCSAESAWCTGQVICANGGMRMSD